ncbi:MAG: glycosyltransferase family 1 protein [Candidatus Electrothrix sp. AR4]|nr:glycosyltransferase family 1 protein [Candidatus Electrothrix sp. AR4]
MRIVIDMQGAQTENRFRRSGHYTLSLAKAMVRKRGDHEITLALNGLFPDTVDAIRDEFNKLLPQEQIRVWYPPGPVQASDSKNEWRCEAAKLIREAFLTSLNPDIVHVTSLFEGFSNNTVTSIGAFTSNFPTAVTVYDFIPLLPPEQGLKNSIFSNYYQKKIEILNHADILLAISDSSRGASYDVFGIPKESVVNISATCDAIFEQGAVEEERRKKLFYQLDIKHKYILYTGGSNPGKNLNRLIEAYAGLPEQSQKKYQLVLAEKISNNILVQLKKTAKSKNIPKDRIVFTGFITKENLLTLYNLCEVFVFPSAHEGCRLPALEAMSCGAAVIASDATIIPEGTARQNALFNPLDVQSICTILQRVLENKTFRDSLRAYGLQRAKASSWDESAKRVLAAFEKRYATSATDSYSQPAVPVAIDILVNKLAKLHCSHVEPIDDDLRACAWCIERNQPKQDSRKKQLLLDISNLSQRDVKTGVQRVVRSILRELLIAPPAGYRVEPVFALPNCKGYRYAKSFSRQFMDWDKDEQGDDPIDFQPGDVFLGLDLLIHHLGRQYDYLSILRQNGVQVFFVVYDLLPLTSGYFSQNIKKNYAQWLKMIMDFDGVICISRAVADELKVWRRKNIPPRIRPFSIEWFHLGADIENSMPSRGLPADAEEALENLQSKPSFLMVGTVEPRKGHRQVLTAFEQLWKQGIDMNLVIVGVSGWMVEKLVEAMRHHRELNKRLFWLEGITDEYLQKLYAVCTCLIAASEGEGFGLPLIEAAQHDLPIIARNLPVFREVAGEHAFYFSGRQSERLANAIQNWLGLNKKGRVPQSVGMPWLTWSESKTQLVNAICKKKVLLERGDIS